MSGRIEYKYLVPNAHLDAIRAAILPYVTTDPFAEQGHGEYTVRSVYFDTPQSACYHEKLDGLEARKKFRIRGYNHADQESVVFLEIKRKHGNCISKHRAPLLHADLDRFMAAPSLDSEMLRTDIASQARGDANKFLYYYYRLRLRPSVLVVYDREAFMGRFDASLRMTFDKNLRGEVSPSLAGLFRDRGLEQALAGHFIFEVKFFRGALPVWVISLIKRFALKRMALSKFTICLDTGHARWGSGKVAKHVPAAAMQAVGPSGG